MAKTVLEVAWQQLANTDTCALDLSGRTTGRPLVAIFTWDGQAPSAISTQQYTGNGFTQQAIVDNADRVCGVIYTKDGADANDNGTLNVVLDAQAVSFAGWAGELNPDGETFSSWQVVLEGGASVADTSIVSGALTPANASNVVLGGGMLEDGNAYDPGDTASLTNYLRTCGTSNRHSIPVSWQEDMATSSQTSTITSGDGTDHHRGWLVVANFGGAAANPGIDIDLTEDDRTTARANLANIDWAVRAGANDEATLVKGTAETTDGAGKLVIDNDLVGSVGTWRILTLAADYTGSHTGAADAAVLTDSAANWRVDELVGRTITNDTDGSSGVITANTANTVTATLSGGTDNDWDNGDTYTIENALTAMSWVQVVDLNA